jgi:hypothetical protein
VPLFTRLELVLEGPEIWNVPRKGNEIVKSGSEINGIEKGETKGNM